MMMMMTTTIIMIIIIIIIIIIIVQNVDDIFQAVIVLKNPFKGIRKLIENVGGTA